MAVALYLFTVFLLVITAAFFGFAAFALWATWPWISLACVVVVVLALADLLLAKAILE